MTLIVLLLVLITERVGLQASHWQVQTYLNYYISIALPKFSQVKASKISLLLFISAPAVVLYLVLHLLNNGLISFVVSLFILAICIGNPESRALYRQYLNAVSRDDKEAQVILHSKLAQTPLTDDAVDAEIDDIEEKTTSDNEDSSAVQETLGETLIWINFRYYAVPIFYFVLLGTPGVVLYSTLLYLVEFKGIKQSEELENCEAHNEKELRLWLEWSYWLPSRLVSLGFMVVGNFTNGLETWLKYAVNFSKSSKEMLCQVALESEKYTAFANDNNAEHMVKLTKRNMGLFIVVVALLTLYGQII
ncbi:regulatory signaling modulator protein AmpE [Psychrosphaera sp. F3M07]|uniref:regulatory signaling modulator protein AmpE n=1 Tax=Psychrosphaera sp. F3M07 TaxID=2841560 RepID=UPI001C09AA3C|nr:regulatory signaling modulator protein AmpE [Psychrosphaera sp. F3M07]MBU2919119.1 regulatory signaling modulator protein AmpE [Psychrosphaera sp. F3M07]